MISMRKAIIASLPFILLFSLVSPISDAENELPTMSILPSYQAVYFNDIFTVDIVVDAENITLIECYISFDPELLQVISVENGEIFDSLVSTGTIDNINGTIDDIWGMVPLEENITPVSGGIFATITFKAKETVGIANINITKALVPPYVGGINLTLNNATVEVRNPPVYVSIEPTYDLVGNETTFDINIDPNGNELSIMTFNILFNSSIFHVEDVIDGGLFNTPTYSWDNNTGVINIFVVQAPPIPGISNPGTLASIKCKPIQTGTSYINITNMEIVDAYGNHLYFVTQNATLEADLTPPSVTFEVGTPYYNDGINEWISSSTPLYINASDEHNYTIYYRIWNGSWGAWQSGLMDTNLILHIQDEGLHYLEYYASDSLGNPSDIYNVSFYVDNTPPATTSTINPASPDGSNGWYVSDVVITLTSNDTGSGIDTIFYRIGDGDWNEYTGNISLTEDGTHTIYYYAVDNVGNVEEEKSIEMKIDKTSPEISYNITGTPGSNGWYVSDIVIEAIATDATSGISEIKYKIDDEWIDYTEPFSLSDGIYSIEIYAKDAAGNEANVTFEAKVDKTKPTASHVLQGTIEDGKYTTDVTVVLSASDNLAEVKEIHYRVDGGNWQIFSGASGSDTIATEGDHTIEYYAVDNAGNVGATHSATFTIEKNKKPVADFSYSPSQPTDLDPHIYFFFSYSYRKSCCMSGAVIVCYSKCNIIGSCLFIYMHWISFITNISIPEVPCIIDYVSVVIEG